MGGRARSRRGATLIIVLGVLIVLALLGTVFASLQSVEREVSRNYLDQVRAQLAAMSGVEAAVERLLTNAESGRLVDPSMQYWGGNDQETGIPDGATPLERAKNPSFAWEDETPQDPADASVTPLLVTIDGQPLGISGMLSGGSYAPNGDVYRLRVTDANSLLHVNDGIENGNNGYGSLNLKRILNNLGMIVGVSNAGDRIVGSRPVTGFGSKKELESVLGRADYVRIAPYVTTSAWGDADVCNPVPLSPQALSSYPVPYNGTLGLYRYGRSRHFAGATLNPNTYPMLFAPEHTDPLGIHHALLAFDELYAPYIEVCRRSPVNVNLASREVLTALIVGLRGFYVSERRKSNPNAHIYSFLSHPTCWYMPDANYGDEIGYLYSTFPFVDDTAPSTNGFPASRVVDEILACRNREPSPGMSGVDYAAVGYGGPFRTWRQFEAFCDALAANLLQDPRAIFYDHTAAVLDSSTSTDARGPDTFVPSAIQTNFAAQAMADVLKANFNPNVTLNELNPDANLHRIVDKTDLIVNSTEFCFSPMGIFEIESEGMILHVREGGDLLAVREGRTAARSKILCDVRVYDAIRETSQAQFYGGTTAPLPTGSAITNNNGVLEIGPEPDNGDAPRNCRWGGWIQLATLGGHRSAGDRHVPDLLETTPLGGPELGDVAHGHFSVDHRLHHHASGGVDPLRYPQNFNTGFRNNSDRTETVAGPYGPAGPTAGRHRLGRNWSASAPPVSPQYTAVSDLRLDGAYVERDSALMYPIDASVFDLEGTVSYWLKPSYRPEMTGKPRAYFHMDTCITMPSTTPNSYYYYPMVNGHWFFPSHDAPAYSASVTETQSPVYSSGPWRPTSFVCGYSTQGGASGGVGYTTPSLNHRAHLDTQRPDLLKHHEWIHVSYRWNMNPDQHRAQLLVNGVDLMGLGDINVHPTNLNTVADFTGFNTLRIGAATFSRVLTASGYIFQLSRNWAADATIDEFYLWKGNHLATSQDLYYGGRYHVPQPGSGWGFTSRALALNPATDRSLAPEVAQSPPANSYPNPPSPPTGTSNSASNPMVRILSAAWTWHPEKSDPTGAPKMTDHSLGSDIDVNVEMSFLVDGTPSGSMMANSGGSAAGDVRIVGGQSLQYRLRVVMPEATADTLLHATPVIDDVTIFFTRSVQYLSYVMVSESL